MIRAILTDIEGTTTSIAFVHDVLFPYAKQRIAEFVLELADQPEVATQLVAVSAIEGRTLTPQRAGSVLEDWIDADRKVAPLKALQGMIWARGYADGTLEGHVYPEVPGQLRRWRTAGKRLYVYSSGSVEAQQLIFGYSCAGDLRPLFSGYFDTRVGTKREAISYRAITGQIDLPRSEVLFLSDVGAELDAARAAGLQTCQLLRDNTVPPAVGHQQVRDFSQIQLD